MKAFWRMDALTAMEQQLLATVLGAHRASVERDNLSTVAIKVAWAGSGDFTKALAAGLMTLGGLHAPIAQTMELLRSPGAAETARQMTARGGRVPGWGNSFVRRAPDPIWREADRVLRSGWPDLARTIDSVTFALHGAGKLIYPNPSAYTAATALALEVPERLAPWLLVAGRFEGWAGLMAGGGLR